MRKVGQQGVFSVGAGRPALHFKNNVFIIFLVAKSRKCKVGHSLKEIIIILLKNIQLYTFYFLVPEPMVDGLRDVHARE